MKHMKKAILFAAVCCMAFSGCGKSDDDAVEETTENCRIRDNRRTSHRDGRRGNRN